MLAPLLHPGCGARDQQARAAVRAAGAAAARKASSRRQAVVVAHPRIRPAHPLAHSLPPPAGSGTRPSCCPPRCGAWRGWRRAAGRAQPSGRCPWSSCRPAGAAARGRPAGAASAGSGERPRRREVGRRRASRPPTPRAAAPAPPLERSRVSMGRPPWTGRGARRAPPPPGLVPPLPFVRASAVFPRPFPHAGREQRQRTTATLPACLLMLLLTLRSLQSPLLARLTLPLRITAPMPRRAAGHAVPSARGGKEFFWSRPTHLSPFPLPCV